MKVQSERSKLIEGEDITIEAVIKNNNDASASSFNVRFYDGDPNDSGTQIGEAQAITSISAQGTQTAQVVWTPTRLHGEKQVYVNIDPEDSVPETNDQNNASSASLILNQRFFTLNLAQDINMFALPLEPETQYTARSLANELGANTVVRYNTEQGQFESFLPDFHTTDGFPIEGYAGYIVILPEAKSVIFEGISHLGAVQVKADMNMLGLPLQPDTPYTAKTWGTELGASTLVRYDTTSGQFEGFIPGFYTGSGFEIEGGEGYIVVGTENKSVTFTGKGWLDSESPSSSPLLIKPPENIADKASMFSIVGYICEPDGKTPVSKPYDIRVINQSFKAKAETQTDVESGQYAIALVDISNQHPVSKGDTINVMIMDSKGKVIGVPITHTLTKDEIKARFVRLDASLQRQIPKTNWLGQNFPNPFNPDTWIPYQLSEDANVTIKIYNVAGQLVRTLNLGYIPVGYYMEKEKTAYWNGRNDVGERTASGLYFYTIKAGKFTATKKMVILK